MRSHRIPPFCSACHRVEAWKDVQELVTLVGTQIANDRTIELTFPANPDAKYLLKGGTRSVWEEFGLPAKWRSKLGEGLIDGKRCGVTQNLGPATRARPTAKMNTASPERRVR